MMLKIVLFFLIVGLVAPIQADETSQATAAQPQVEQRVRNYLDALKIRDLQTAYQMESGSLNGTLTADAFYRYMTSSSADLLSYEIQSVSVEGEKATVELTATYKYPQLSQPTSMPRKSHWLLINGQWYRGADQSQSAAKSPFSVR